MKKTVLIEGAGSATEASIRAQLATVLEEARRCLSKIPLFHRPNHTAEITSARALMDTSNALLAEAQALTDALRDIDALSVEGAMCCGAVAVAVNAATDALAVVQAQIDSFAA